jgi:hypothetical protein
MENEKRKLIDTIINSPAVLAMIRDRYTKYQTEEKYFYVPAEFNYDNDTGSIKVDIRDKSYSTIEELEIAVDAWANGRLRDVKPFVEKLWKDKNFKDISVLALIETNEYYFGSVVYVKL